MGIKLPMSGVLSKSPFKPLQEHMRTVLLCAGEVPALFQAVIDDDQERVAALQRRVFELENQADHVKNVLRVRMPKSLFLPVDRRDLLEILDWQDSIADTAQEIAGLFVCRRTPLPASLQQPFLTLSQLCVEACNQCALAVEELDELVELGFSGRKLAEVLAMVDKLSQVEEETDRLGMTISRQLFALEPELSPVDVIFLYQLLRWTGQMADCAEKVGGRLRLLLAR